MKHKFIALFFPLLAVAVWVAAQPPVAPRTRPAKFVAPVLSLPDQKVQSDFLGLLDDMEANDYANFIRAFDENFKGVWTNTVFEKFSLSLARRLEKGYEVHHMGSVRKGLHHTFVWKLVFDDKGDERLTTISYKIVPAGEPFGKVTGFYVD
jgi:hypothetical protein